MAKKEKLITALIAVISVGLAAAAYLILPDTVAMQVSTGGTLQNTNGSDTFVTKWEPPLAGTNGQKLWGDAITTVYW